MARMDELHKNKKQEARGKRQDFSCFLHLASYIYSCHLYIREIRVLNIYPVRDRRSYGVYLRKSFKIL